jgi:NitT/TauT family transport system substrate-binding protein
MTPRLGISRRTALRGTAALAASAFAPVLPRPALAAQRPVKFTLAWLAEGSSVYVYVARAKGIMQARGIDLSVTRGFGSVASSQAVAAGQYDFGVVAAPVLVLAVAKQLPIIALATCDYDSTMGVGVLADSPIKTPQELAGKKIGAVPTSGEFPFFPAYAKKAGFDLASVNIVHVDNKVLEQLLIEKQVDAIMGFGSSSLPVMLSKDIPVRWMLYNTVGIRNYGQTLTTKRETLAKDPALCEALVDGMLEAVAYTLTNPDESLAMFLKEVPEMALSASSQNFARLGLGIWQHGIDQPDAREHGIGWSNPTGYAEMADLVMQYLGAPGMQKPEPDATYTNRFAGKPTLSSAQWAQVDARVAEFGKYIS